MSKKIHLFLAIILMTGTSLFAGGDETPWDQQDEQTYTKGKDFDQFMIEQQEAYDRYYAEKVAQEMQHGTHVHVHIHNHKDDGKDTKHSHSNKALPVHNKHLVSTSSTHNRSNPKAFANSRDSVIAARIKELEELQSIIRNLTHEIAVDRSRIPTLKVEDQERAVFELSIKEAQLAEAQKRARAIEAELRLEF